MAATRNEWQWLCECKHVTIELIHQKIRREQKKKEEKHWMKSKVWKKKKCWCLLMLTHVWLDRNAYRCNNRETLSTTCYSSLHWSNNIPKMNNGTAKKKIFYRNKRNQTINILQNKSLEQRHSIPLYTNLNKCWTLNNINIKTMLWLKIRRTTEKAHRQCEHTLLSNEPPTKSAEWLTIDIRYTFTRASSIWHYFRGHELDNKSQGECINDQNIQCWT